MLSIFNLFLGVMAISQAIASLSIGSEGLNLIKNFEGLRLTAYQDSVGVWTIGYGHTSGVKKGQRITRAQADAYLRQDVAWAESAVNRAVTVSLYQSQFDALVSWTFNLGSGNLRRSTMLKRVNAKNWSRVPCEMIRWNKAGGKVLPGLVRRRKAEAELFNGGPFTC